MYTGITGAQTIPMTIRITELVDINLDLDGGLFPSPGDLYAELNIDGVSINNFDDRFSVTPDDGPGFLTPWHYNPTPPAWEFTQEVSISNGPIPITIEIWDDDGITSNDQADINPGDSKSISILVDPVTGLWSGDVSSPTNCSQGADGQEVKVCWEIEVDDPDKDGLPSLWEISGIDFDNDGTIDLDLPALGADPQKKDIFVEVDYMEFHKPRSQAIADAIQAFANAPVNNPDGSQGITLHVEVDEQVPHQDNITVWSGFDAIKATNFGTLAQRGEDPNQPNPNADNVIAAKKLAYRYAIFMHRVNNSSVSGMAELDPTGEGGNDFIVSLGGPEWGLNDDGTHNVGTLKQQAGTFVHELGHTLGLFHGGQDPDINCKPNYLSVMNYLFQVGYIPDGEGEGRLDLSSRELPELNETLLDEALGIQGGSDYTFWNTGFFTETGAGNGPLDWNGNDNIDGNLVNVDINNFTGSIGGCDGFGDVYTGHDDWSNLKYNFRNSTGFETGSHPPLIQELTGEDAKAIEDMFDNFFTADLSLTITDDPDPVIAGNNLSYEITIENTGALDAKSVTLENTHPSGVELLDAIASQGSCAESGGIIDCDLGLIASSASANVTITIAVDPATIGTLNNTATASTVTPDKDMTNNEDTEVTESITPAGAIRDLIDLVGAMGLPKGVRNSLIAPLKQAPKLLEDANPNNDIAVCEKLNAFLIHVDEKETNGNITTEQANSLRDAVALIENALGC